MLKSKTYYIHAYQIASNTHTYTHVVGLRINIGSSIAKQRHHFRVTCPSSAHQGSGSVLSSTIFKKVLILIMKEVIFEYIMRYVYIFIIYIIIYLYLFIRIRIRKGVYTYIVSSVYRRALVQQQLCVLEMIFPGSPDKGRISRLTYNTGVVIIGKTIIIPLNIINWFSSWSDLIFLS